MPEDTSQESAPAVTETQEKFVFSKYYKAEVKIYAEVNGCSVEISVNLDGTRQSIGEQIQEITRNLQANQD